MHEPKIKEPTPREIVVDVLATTLYELWTTKRWIGAGTPAGPGGVEPGTIVAQRRRLSPDCLRRQKAATEARTS